MKKLGIAGCGRLAAATVGVCAWFLMAPGCSGGGGKGSSGDHPEGSGGGTRAQGVPIFATPAIVSKGFEAAVDLQLTGACVDDDVRKLDIWFSGLIGSASTIVQTGTPDYSIDAPAGGKTLVHWKIKTLTSAWDTPTTVAAVKVSFKNPDYANIVSTTISVTDEPRRWPSETVGRSAPDVAARSVSGAAALATTGQPGVPVAQGVPIFGGNVEVRGGMAAYAPVLLRAAADGTYRVVFNEPDLAARYFGTPVVNADPSKADQVLVYFRPIANALTDPTRLTYTVRVDGENQTATGTVKIIR